LTLAGRTASQFWQTTGNNGTAPTTHFLGTTDNQPLEFRVNNKRALRLEPASTNDWVNVIAGSARNFVASGVIGATISGGGGVDSFPGTPYSNSVAASFGTIAGGNFNNISAAGTYSAVGGGGGNTMSNSCNFSTI